MGFNDGSNSINVFVNSLKTLTAIDFSEAYNLEYIGSFCFSNCSLVETFDLSKCTKLRYIGVSAFLNCFKAKTIILPNSPLKNIPGACFGRCYALTSMRIPSNIECFDPGSPEEIGCFYQTSSLVTLYFESDSNLKYVNGKCFIHSGLQTIRLPKQVVSINSYSFRVCRNLRSIDVDPLNPNFKSINGIL